MYHRANAGATENALRGANRKVGMRAAGVQWRAGSCALAAFAQPEGGAIGVCEQSENRDEPVYAKLRST